MRTTKLHTYTLVVMLVVGVASSGMPWGIENEIASWVSFNREAQGLSSVQHSEALSRAAYDYSVLMRQAGKYGHLLSLPSEKLTRINAYAQQLSETSKLAGLYIIENVGTVPMGNPEEISHMFDTSPPHAKAMYYKDVVYIGWGISVDNNTYYVTLYLAIGGIDGWD